MASSDDGDWSKLPYDLVSLILSRIPNVSDCARLRATCKSLYYPPDAHPIGDGRKFLGSSNGWLLVADSSADLHIVDPRTGAYAPLPPTSTLSNVKRVKQDGRGRIVGYTTKHRSPDQTVDFLFHRVGCFWDDHCRLVRIFPWTASAAVFVTHGTGRLSVAKPGDGSWTKIRRHKSLNIADVLQLNGLFYVMSMRPSGPVIAILDIRFCPPRVALIRNYDSWFLSSVSRKARSNREYYLACDGDGDGLVLVCRHSSRANGETVSFEAARMGLVLDDDGRLDHISYEIVGQGPGLLLLRRCDTMMVAPANDLLREVVGPTEDCIFFIDGDGDNSDVGIYGVEGGEDPSFRFSASASLGGEVGKSLSSYLCEGRPPVWVPAPVAEPGGVPPPPLENFQFSRPWFLIFE